jgi:hypothetical protein
MGLVVVHHQWKIQHGFDVEDDTPTSHKDQEESTQHKERLDATNKHKRYNLFNDPDNGNIHLVNRGSQGVLMTSPTTKTA